MFTATDFTYNGRLASEFGLTVVNVGTISSTQSFGLNRQILETQRLSGINSFHGFSYEPIEFQVTLARECEWDYYTRIEVARWLFQNNYKELINPDHPEIIYNVLFFGDNPIGLVGNIPRYITLNVRADAPWGWSEEYTYEYDCDTVLVVELENLSNLNMPIYPEIEIVLTTGETLSIDFDTDKEWKFVDATYSGDDYNLVSGETIYVDNNKKIIISDQTGSEDARIKNFIKSDATKERSDWFYLTEGTNTFTLNGNGDFSIRIKFPMVA